LLDVKQPSHKFIISILKSVIKEDTMT